MGEGESVIKRKVSEELMVNKKFISIYINDRKVSLLQAQLENDRIVVNNFHNTELRRGTIEEGNIKDYSKLLQILREIVVKNKLKRKRTVFTIATKQFFQRIVALPPMPDSERTEAVKWEIAPFLSYPIKKMIVDSCGVGKGTEGGVKKDYLLVAALPEELGVTYTNLIRNSGLIPWIMDVSTLALYRCYLELRPVERKDIILIYIDDDQGQFIFQKSKTERLVYRTFYHSGNFTSELAKFCDYIKGKQDVKISEAILLGQISEEIRQAVSAKGLIARKIESNKIVGPIEEIEPVCLGLLLGKGDNLATN